MSDLRQLFDALLDDSITPDQHTELTRRLDADEATRRAWADYVHLHTALLCEHTAPVAAAEKNSKFAVEDRRSPIRNSKKKIRSHQFAAGESSYFEFRVSSLTLALAATILLALTAWFIFSAEPRTLNPEPSPTPPASVATLTNTHNAVFANTAAPMQLGQSLPPGPIQLTAGKAQVMFASTAMVDLTGPCEFEMTGPNRGRLTAGRLEAFVPQNAKGFTIDLPGGSKVVDLGTAFEIDVAQTGCSVVHVAEGRVELIAPDQSAVTLSHGQRARIVAGRIGRLDDARPIALANADFERLHPDAESDQPVTLPIGWHTRGWSATRQREGGRPESDRPIFVPGWDGHASGVTAPGPRLAAGHAGRHTAFLTAGGHVEQTVPVPWRPGDRFELSLRVGHRADIAYAPLGIKLTLDGRPLTSTRVHTPTPEAGRFATWTIRYHAPITSDPPSAGSSANPQTPGILRLRFVAEPAGRQVLIDDITLKHITFDAFNEPKSATSSLNKEQTHEKE